MSSTRSPSRSTAIEAFARLGLGQAGVDHRVPRESADAAAGGAGADDGDALLGQRHAGHLHRREQRAGSDRGRALDVVVEGAERSR